jgi:hypothetical protein
MRTRLEDGSADHEARRFADGGAGGGERERHGDARPLLCRRHDDHGLGRTGGRYNKPQGYAVNIGVDTPEDAGRIFAALSQGGTVGMPMGETFWARRFGMVTDRFGTHWMVNCEKAM